MTPRPVLLAYRALGLGDLLCGVPALRALRDGFPEHRLVLAAPAALAPLAALTGAVDEVADTAPLGPAPAGADVAVNLHGRGPQSHAVLRAAAPGRLIAFACGEHAGPEWRAGEHEVHRWCRLLSESGIPADPSRLDLPKPSTTLRNEPSTTLRKGPGPFGRVVEGWGAEPSTTLRKGPGPVLVHPGAASGARRWPAERWAAVAAELRRGGRRVVVTGSADERELALRVARGAGLPEADVVAGRTGLLELAALVADAALVLCGDTGVAHLATAFGTPSVVLFGPTPPEEWGPPVDRPQHVVLHRRPGREYRGDPHASEPDPALLAVSVADVLEVTTARVPTLTIG